MRRSIPAVLAALCILSSCSPKAGKAGGEAAPPLPGETETAVPVRFPEGGEARIVQREGSAELVRGPKVLAPEEGALLALDDRARTGEDGELEVALGGLASFRLLPGSEAKLRTAVLAEGGSRVEILVLRGTVLFDVRSLAARESFTVHTPQAISVVRGTRFSVTAGDAAAVAVREGRVAVLPSSPELERMAEAARTSAPARAALRAVLARAPAADPSRRIEVDPAVRSRAGRAYAELEAELAELPALALDPASAAEPVFPAGELPAPPEPDAGTREVLSRAREAAGRVPGQLAVPVNAGPETLRVLDRFRDFRSGPALSPAAPPAVHPALLGRTSLSARPLAGSLVRVPDAGILVAADETGALYAFDAEGRGLWSVHTSNRGDIRSYPVSYKGAAYYAGDRELLAVDGRDGTVLARRALDPGLKPGERPAPFPDALLLPTDSGFDVLDARTLEVRTSVPVAGGPGTLPTLRDSFALIVSKEGDLLLMDPIAGDVRAQTPTGARGSVAVSPRVYEERACFADRTGLVVMVDLAQMKVIWERRTGVEILTDIEIAREGVLAYGDGTLFGFRLDGEALMPPVRGVSAPPLLSRGTVFYGTQEGNLVVAQASPWKIRGTMPLGDVPSARPLQVGETLYVGTRGGRLVRIDTAKLP